MKSGICLQNVYSCALWLFGGGGGGGGGGSGGGGGVGDDYDFKSFKAVITCFFQTRIGVFNW